MVDQPQVAPVPYAFRLGAWPAWVLSDGASVIGRAGVLKRFPQVDERELEAAYTREGQSIDAAESHMNILCLRIDGRIVLVDAGQGGRPRGGRLPDMLAQIGIAPAEVDTIILTHAHVDHVLGLLTPDGRPQFPRASCMMSAVEYAVWSGSARSDEQEAAWSLVSGGPLQLVKPGDTLLPGITAFDLAGHTPGQIGLRLESEGDRLLHVADALHLIIQIGQPGWSPTYDADPAQAAGTRARVLRSLAADGDRALAYHLPLPGLFRVRPGEDRLHPA